MELEFFDMLNINAAIKPVTLRIDLSGAFGRNIKDVEITHKDGSIETIVIRNKLVDVQAIR